MYPLYDRSSDRLKEALNPLRRKYHREFHALRNVSISVGKGECVGLIGMNGSGKSTLLQIIAGVVTPTSGHYTLKGRLSALLELGAGFNPEYSGVENARFQCALMGIAQKKVPQLLEEIINFADIGDFIYQPVKTFSSGMYVRLAFATAIAVQPDILIVDEALAVGDMYFQTKCLAKIRELRDSGRTLLFVSHDPGAVKSLCDRAYLLHKGEVLDSGSPDQVFNLYNSLIAVKSESEIQGKTQELRKRYGTGKIEIQQVRMKTKNGYENIAFTGDKIALEIVFTAHEDVVNPTIGISIRDRAGIEMFGTNNFVLSTDFGLVRRNQRYVVSYDLDLQLGPNQYTVAVAAHPFDNHVIDCFDWINDALVFRVLPSDSLRFSGSCRFETTVDCIPVN
jgi:lipopolysaccharide transport system ATP-binding protein